MSDSAPQPSANYFGYPDLAGLKTAHARLIQQQEERPSQKSPADEFLDTVSDFVIRAQATGQVLGTDDDRTAAQNIIDYWVTVLMRGRRTPPETGLAEFHSQPGSTESLRNRPVAEYLAEERTTIRRRLGLSAAAAQWDDAERPRALLWGGPQLDEAANYDDLTPLEREFIAASRSDERRSLLRRRIVLYSALTAAALIVALVISNLVALRTAAEQRRDAAEQRARTEQESRERAQRLFATKLVERSGFLLRQGDIAGALLWQTDALATCDRPENEALHRLRIGTARAQLPKLEQIFLEEKSAYLCNNARFNADGSRVVTIANEKGGGGVARLWEAASGRLLAEFPEPDAQVNDAGFFSDGRVFTATGTRGSGKGALRFWKDSGAPDGGFENLGGAVIFAVASPVRDGENRDLVPERIGFCVEGAEGRSMIVEVRRIADGVSMTAPLAWAGEVRELIFSPSGTYFVAGGSVQAPVARDDQSLAGQVGVWNAWTGAESSWEIRTTLPVTTVAFSPDDHALALGTGQAGDRPGTVEVWEIFAAMPTVQADRPITTRRLFAGEHGKQVSSVAFHPEGRRVLSSSHDETVRVWDARRGGPIFEVRHESSVFRATFSPDGRWIVSGGRDQTARVWDALTGRPEVAPLNHAGTVAHVRFDPAGERLLTTTTDGARLWRLRTGEPPAPILRLNEPVWKMTVSDDGQRAVAIGRYGNLGQWEVKTGQGASGRLPFHEGSGAFFSPDARRVLVAARPSLGSTRESVRLHQLAPEVTHGPTLAIKGPITCAVFSPDGQRLFVASGPRGTEAGQAELRDVTTGDRTVPALEIAGTVTYAAFSPDGRYLLTAGGSTSPVGGEARVWDAATGEALTPPLRHDEQITHASFSSDLRLLITASVDDSAKIWELDLAKKGARQAHRLAEHSADVGHASFSPKGGYAVTASFDRSAMVWSIAEGKRISILLHPGWINDAQFNKDGRFLVTACSDQIARVWEVATGDVIALFRHNGEVTKAFFTPAGDVMTLSLDEPAARVREARASGQAGAESAPRRTMLRAQTWRLVPAEEPAAALTAFARILRAHHIEKERDLVRLKRPEFAALWKEHAALMHAVAAEVPEPPPFLAVADSEATGQWFAARWHLSRALKAQPDDAALLARRGEAATLLRQWEAAIADFERAVMLKPTADAYLHLSRADLELNRYGEAVEHATKGLAIEPRHALYMNRAEAFAAQEDWTAAVEDLERAIALQPALGAPYERLAAVRLKQNLPEEYRKTCARLLDRVEKDNSLASTAAWACALSPGALEDPAKIVELARLTLTRQPTPYYDLNTLGAALFRAGQDEEALRRLQESRDAYIKEATLLEAQGSPQAAIMPIADGRPVDWVFLSMIATKQNRRSEAEVWLNRATAALQARSVTDPRRAWHRIELETLIEEAKAALAAKAPAS